MEKNSPSLVVKEIQRYIRQLYPKKKTGKKKCKLKQQ